MSDTPSPFQTRASVAVDMAMELTGIAQRSAEATAEASRRLVRAVIVTLLGPVNVLVQLSIFQDSGWSVGGKATLGGALLLSVALWAWWAPSFFEARKQREAFLRSRKNSSTARSRFIRTSSLWRA